jgi:diaminopimelate decarboxylase
MYGSYHPIVVANKLVATEEEKWDIAGPICESGDLLAKDRRMPKLEEGDLLASSTQAPTVQHEQPIQFASPSRRSHGERRKIQLIREREQLDDLMRNQNQSAEWQP